MKKNRYFGYIRVSTEKQDQKNQKLAIHDYARDNDIKITEFINVQISSKKSPKERKIDQIWEKLKSEDTLIVTELSRLGRSLGQIITIVDRLLERNIKFISLKEKIFLTDGEQDIQSKVTIAMFGLFADIEQDFISQRTKQGLMLAKLRGKLPGRPKGTLGKSKLDGKEKEIKNLLDLGVSKSSIAKILGASRSTLFHFIQSRKLG